MKNKHKILNIISCILAAIIVIDLVLSGLSLSGKNIPESVYGAASDIIPEQSETAPDDLESDPEEEQEDEPEPEQEPEDEPILPTAEPEDPDDAIEIVSEEYTEDKPDTGETEDPDEPNQNDNKNDPDEHKDNDDPMPDPVIETDLDEIIGDDEVIGKYESVVTDDSLLFHAKMTADSSDTRKFSFSVSSSPVDVISVDKNEGSYSLSDLKTGTTYSVTLCIIDSDGKVFKKETYSFRYTEISIDTNIYELIGEDELVLRRELDSDIFTFNASVQGEYTGSSLQIRYKISDSGSYQTLESTDGQYKIILTPGETYTVELSVLKGSETIVKNKDAFFIYADVDVKTDLSEKIGESGILYPNDGELTDGTLDFSAWIVKNSNDNSDYRLSVRYYPAGSPSDITELTAEGRTENKQDFKINTAELSLGTDYCVEINVLLDGKTIGEALSVTFRYVDVSIASNLYDDIIGEDGILYTDELDENLLSFKAHIENNNGFTLGCQYRQDKGSFRTLTPSSILDNENIYGLDLVPGSSYEIRLYIREKDQSYSKTYTFRYADRNTDPITLVTNLPDTAADPSTPYYTKNRQLTVSVHAYNNAGDLTSDKMTVTLTQDAGSSVEVKNPTGGPVYEYEMYFTDPEVGDDVFYTLDIKAADQKGNETEKVYYIQYHFIAEGDKTGTVHIVLDATTVGCGILDETDVEIEQGKPASYTVAGALEDCGYEIETGGTLDNGFYLSRISRGGLMDGAEVPERLWNLIQKDGLGLTGQSFYDSIGEHDFTQGSGWMYSVNDGGYASKGLSGYYLSDGDVLYLRFTLAFGKDIGGYDSSGGAYGVLPYYCGTWINGEELLYHEWVEETADPTCTEDGETTVKCSICDEVSSVTVIPALGHDWVETERSEPTTETEGYIKYRCQRDGCTEEKTESLPMLTPEPAKEPDADPDEEPEEGGTEE